MSGLGVKVATGGDRGVDAAYPQPGLQTAGSSSLRLLISQRRRARLQLEKATLLMDTGRMLFPMHTRLSRPGAAFLPGQLPAPLTAIRLAR